jgi:serine/threonine-protein kinase
MKGAGGGRSPGKKALDQLACYGRPDGPSLDEALQLFADVRAQPEEGRAIAQLLALEASAPLPEPLLVAVASALADRGEGATAAQVLARAASTAALMLRADLLAAAGDLAVALSLVERVLLRDIDRLGARERHARWRLALGVAEAPKPPDTAATLLTSEPESPFRLIREVGRGGAGTVYEAEDRELGRRVALKVYHRPDRDRAQLLHEARVAVALAGPGIVRVFDVDPDHGWIAMEWARHGTLRSWLRERSPAVQPMKPIESWVHSLARCLARVHASGWVHHDVKPANILLARSTDGGETPGVVPLLTDFGTARRIGEPSPPGSLGYVSPERLAGRPSSPRDDVYGFGRVLEEALGEGALGEGGEGARPWRTLALMCTGPDEGRPDSGATLVSYLSSNNESAPSIPSPPAARARHEAGT